MRYETQRLCEKFAKFVGFRVAQPNLPCDQFPKLELLVSKPELLVKGPSDNTQVLLEEIESKYGNKTFRANELKDISKLSYDELKDALFELLESKLTMEFDENEEVIRYQLKK